MSDVLLPYSPPCVEAVFRARHKRFSVLAELDGEPIGVHSNNTGTMLGLLRPGAPMLASLAANTARKLPYTQEALWLGNRHVTDPQGFWVGVNTAVPNRMLAAAFAAGALPFARGYTTFTPEAKCGASRMDARLSGPELPNMWVECKNVTLVEDGVALFPDAATERGQKHLLELMSLVNRGERAVMLYLVQRPDAACFAPAEIIDPDYARLFWQARATGVEIYPFLAHVSPAGIRLGEVLPLARCAGEAEHMSPAINAEGRF